VDMAGSVARRSIKDKKGGTELLRLDTLNGRITIDNANHTITETISAADTAAITWKKGVTDFELENSAGYVIAIESDNVVVEDEVTTT